MVRKLGEAMAIVVVLKEPVFGAAGRHGGCVVSSAQRNLTM